MSATRSWLHSCLHSRLPSRPLALGLAAFIAAAALIPAGCVAAQEAQPVLPQARLAAATPKGPVPLEVELAATPTEQEFGLMFRKTMAPNAGMLFIFPRAQMQAFWMKNTVLPLDLLFIRADGTISSIRDHAVPFDLTTISSTEPVRYVLELNAGRAAALGLKPGEKFSGPALAAGR